MGPEEVLPPGWETTTDTAGRRYYWNTSDGTTTWEKPKILPLGWEARTDPKSGKTYYWNTSDGIWSWDKPTANDDQTPEPEPVLNYELKQGWQHLWVLRSISSKKRAEACDRLTVKLGELGYTLAGFKSRGSRKIAFSLLKDGDEDPNYVLRLTMDMSCKGHLKEIARVEELTKSLSGASCPVKAEKIICPTIAHFKIKKWGGKYDLVGEIQPMVTMGNRAEHVKLIARLKRVIRCSRCKEWRTDESLRKGQYCDHDFEALVHNDIDWGRNDGGIAQSGIPPGKDYAVFIDVDMKWKPYKG